MLRISSPKVNKQRSTTTRWKKTLQIVVPWTKKNKRAARLALLSPKGTLTMWQWTWMRYSRIWTKWLSRQQKMMVKTAFSTSRRKWEELEKIPRGKFSCAAAASFLYFPRRVIKKSAQKSHRPKACSITFCLSHNFSINNFFYSAVRILQTTLEPRQFVIRLYSLDFQFLTYFHATFTS